MRGLGGSFDMICSTAEVCEHTEELEGSGPALDHVHATTRGAF